MIFQVVLTCYFLYALPSSNLSIVCTYLILATTISSVFEFVFNYILYVIDRRKNRDEIFDKADQKKIIIGQ